MTLSQMNLASLIDFGIKKRFDVIGVIQESEYRDGHHKDMLTNIC